MVLVSSYSVVEAAPFDPVNGVIIAVVTVVAVSVAGLIVGISLLFRRHDGARPTSAAGIADLEKRAAAALLRADDALAAGSAELEFAIAQFGEQRSADFASAVAAARTSVADAFRLKQQLDDPYLDSDIERRDWNNRILFLGETATRTLAEQSAAFAALRSTEAESPIRLEALREGIESTRLRLAPAHAAIDRLGGQYLPSAYAAVRDNPERAAKLLDDATARADDAEPRIAASGVNTVSSGIDQGAEAVHAARRLLDEVGAAERSLHDADTALDALVTATKANLAEARAVRNNAPDADSGATLIAAIAGVEVAMPPAEQAGPRDPLAEIERIGTAVIQLDTALAGARNQQQRLEHARTALTGALLGARSQIAVAKKSLSSGRPGVEARTRLAEAERQLSLAETEADPVEALDAARRSTTAARDAEALANYKLL